MGLTDGLTGGLADGVVGGDTDGRWRADLGLAVKLADGKSEGEALWHLPYP